MIRILRVLGVLAALTFSASAWAQGYCPAYEFGKADKPITTLPYTLSQKDICRTKVFNSSSAGAVDIPAPGTAGGFLPAFPVTFYNEGAGTLTLTPLAPVSGSTPTINGQTTITLAQGQGAQLAVGVDGNWYANTTSQSALACTASGATPLTCNGTRGIATTTSLSTAASTDATYTITNSSVTASSNVLCEVVAYSGTYATNGDPVIMSCVPGAGSFVVNIRNVNASNALSGTLGIGFLVLNQ